MIKRARVPGTRRMALTLMLLGALTACATSCSSGDERAAEAASSSSWALRGTYTATTPGPIEEITFYDGSDYFLRKSECAAGEACGQFGKYTLDAERVLTLRSETGETTTLPLGQLPDASLTRQSLRPQQEAPTLVTPSETALVNGAPSPGGFQTSGANGQDGQVFNRTANPRVNVAAAEVFICGSKDGGCAPCTGHLGVAGLEPQQKDAFSTACTLQGVRPWLKEHVEALFSQAGRRGIFLRTTTGDAPVRLTRILVQGAPEEVATTLRGSFVAGGSEVASAGVTFVSANAAVTLSFAFEDATQGGQSLLSDVYPMSKTYNLIPFFYLHGTAGVRLNLGKILSTFGGGPVAATLLSALDGFSLNVDADSKKQWASPRCADAPIDADRSSAALGGYQAFDRDFLKNVLVPLCEQYKSDNGGNVTCAADNGALETVLESSYRALGTRRVLPVEGCTLSKQNPLSANEYTLDFVAPKRWGFIEKDEGFLYTQSGLDARRWEKGERIVVLGHDQGTCGTRSLGADEECVHAQVNKLNFASSCNDVAKGTRRFGVAQTDGVEGVLFDQMPGAR